MRYRRYPEYRDSGVEWLGEIPAHWNSRRLKYVAPVSEVRISGPIGELPYVGLEQIESRTGRLVSVDASRPLDDELTDSAATAFRPGDVLFGKLRPYLAKVLLMDFVGTCSTELLVLRTKDHITPSNLAFQLLSPGFISWINSMTYGTKMPRANPDQVANTKVALAPAGEQRAIAAFLGHETAKIDALVAKKERLIELLQEKRAALITRAVTKGLDPNVPMTDSGVEWLGEIPAHWEVKPFTKYVVEKADYRGSTPEKVASGVFLVTARNVRMGRIDYECSQEFVAQEQYDEIMRRGLPRKGDILFTTEAPLGNVALVDREDIALAQRIIRFRLNGQQFESRFALFAMMSQYFQAQLLSLSTGSTAEGLKASKLTMLRLAAPPPNEQCRIVDFLVRETARLDDLVGKISEAIDRLKEFRTALVSAAVTGKIDVRDHEASTGS